MCPPACSCGSRRRRAWSVCVCVSVRGACGGRGNAMGGFFSPTASGRPSFFVPFPLSLPLSLSLSSHTMLALRSNAATYVELFTLPAHERGGRGRAEGRARPRSPRHQRPQDAIKTAHARGALKTSESPRLLSPHPTPTRPHPLSLTCTAWPTAPPLVSELGEERDGIAGVRALFLSRRAQCPSRALFLTLPSHALHSQPAAPPAPRPCASARTRARTPSRAPRPR